MGNKGKPVYLKVFIDKKKKKVMFAEAEEDFVDILFSFFMLPLGTIARLSSTHSDLQVGSLTSLYESVVKLDGKHFDHEVCRDALVYPRSASSSVFPKLKVNLDDRNPIGATVGDHQGGIAVFVKDKSSFIITDDLNVLPVLCNTSIILLNSLGLRNIDLLDERTMRFGVEEFLNLLKWSLVTNNPLTNLVFGGTKLCSCSCLCSLCIANSTLRNSTLILKHCCKPQMIKLLVQKSKMIVLCAEVGNFFVELLFSILTIPLGIVKRLTMDNSSPVAINNLYDSITSLGDGKCLKSEDIMTMLLCPKVDSYYHRVTDFLPIYEPNTKAGHFLKQQETIIYDTNTKAGHFLKQQETFIVSDDLKVTVSPSTSIVSVLNTLGIPDMEIVEVSIGEQEAILILKASLTSTSVLTDCFNAFTKKGNAVVLI